MSDPVYNENPLRRKLRLVGEAVTSAHSIGAGMCEFEAVDLIHRGTGRLHCVAPARVAIHICAADVVEMVGTMFKGKFYVSDVRATRL